MRLSCLQENLSRGLATVSRAVATRATLPVTQNVLITTDQARLKLAATNLEIAITTWVGAQVEEEGAFTLPARLLSEFVNALANERIDIAPTAKGQGLALKAGRFEANINGVSAEDFPPIPRVESGVAGKIDAQALQRAISHVAFSAATEESRPVLTGVKVEVAGDAFTFAAADGYRLAVYKGTLAEPMAEDASFIIPARTFLELNRLLTGQRDPVEFMVTSAKSQAMFRFGDVEVVSQLVQGTFPNYAQLVPQSHSTRAVVKVDDFLRATRTASIFARDGNGIVRLHITAGEGGAKGRIAISARAEEIGDHVGEFDASVEGADSKIAFSSKYLAEALDVMEKGEGEVALETTTPSSPGVLRPLSDEGYLHVVMPMFVQW